MDTLPAIFDVISQSCEPFELQGLPRRAVSTTTKRLPADEATILRNLASRFSLHDLLATGVARRSSTSENELQLVSSLAGPNLIMPLLQKADKEPYDLVLDAGCYSRQALPLVKSLADFRIKKALGKGLPLVIAPTLSDCAALWDMGLPGTTAVGLDTLGGANLAQVGDALGWQRELLKRATSGSSTSAKVSQKIVLVNWQPANWSLDAPTRILAVTEHFRELRGKLRVRFGPISLWTPTQQALDQFGFVAHFGTAEELEELMQRSLSEHGRALFPELAPMMPAAPDLAEAYGPLARHDELKRPGQTEKTAQLIESALHDNVYAPLLRAAQRSPDPIQRAAIANLALVSRLTHAKVNGLLANLMHRPATERSNNQDDQRSELPAIVGLISQLVRMMDCVTNAHSSSPRTRKVSRQSEHGS